MTLGQKIINLRKARSMTQEELSEAIGVTRQTISKWELDSSTPDLDYLCKLCDLFGVTADYLIRPEKETVETAPPPPTEQAPSLPRTEPTPPPAAPSAKTLSGIRFAGWALFILGIALIQVAILFVLFRISSTALWILAGICIVIGMELFLIRWKPLFIVMWTVWLFWTCSRFIIAGKFILLFSCSGGSLLPVSWTLIFTGLWVFYTAFCIGATVGVICKIVRAKREKRERELMGQ
ncbi:MAG: helix-turn-helix transcriptional regulator [Clostridia bacterium]|nr:helix-turn-helix transcriptional regulator [Clostridia bacterium]